MLNNKEWRACRDPNQVTMSSLLIGLASLWCCGRLSSYCSSCLPTPDSSSPST